MGLWDRMKGQLRSVIEWEDASHLNLFELWSENGDEIKNASKLIVKPGQGAVFLYEGKIEAIHLDEGTFDLETSNIPIWTTISKFMQAFESEHKVGIYFFWKTQFANQKWGTSSPIKYQDPVYNFPVQLRAHGNFSFRIAKPEYFFVNFVGSQNIYPVDQVRVMIMERFVQQLTDVFAEAGFSYADIDKNRVELAESLSGSVAPDLEKLGFEMTDFRIEGTSFDQDTMERINRIADLTAEAAAAKAAGVGYAQLQQLEALRDAAKNEGGAAGAGVGIGAGIGLGQAFAGSMAGGSQQPAGAASGGDQMARLKKVKELLEAGLISQEEFDKKKSEILSEI